MQKNYNITKEELLAPQDIKVKLDAGYALYESNPKKEFSEYDIIQAIEEQKPELLDYLCDIWSNDFDMDSLKKVHRDKVNVDNLKFINVEKSSISSSIKDRFSEVFEEVFEYLFCKEFYCTDIYSENIPQVEEEFIKLDLVIDKKTYSFLVPSYSARLIEYLMLGGITDLKTKIDEEIEFAIKEIISNKFVEKYDENAFSKIVDNSTLSYESIDFNGYDCFELMDKDSNRIYIFVKEEV